MTDEFYSEWLHENLPELADDYYNGRHLQNTPCNDPDTMYDTQPDFKEYCQKEYQEQCDKAEWQAEALQEDLTQ
jgi:hypothetical protein